MKVKVIVVLISIMTLVSFVGCATTSSIVAARDEGKGMSRVYSVSTDQAWNISETVVGWIRMDITEMDKDKGYLLARKGSNLVNAGVLMGLWIKPTEEKNTEVTIITMRRMATNIATIKDEYVHRRFEKAVEITMAGEPLPERDPLKRKRKTRKRRSP